MTQETRVILLTGPAGIGKTTACRHVIDGARRRGLAIGGVLTDTHTAGDGSANRVVTDLGTGEHRVLARGERKQFARATRSRVLAGVCAAGAPRWRWVFDAEGLAQRSRALSRCATGKGDLLVVDHVGAGELHGGGWLEVSDALRLGGYEVALVVVDQAVVDEVVRRLGDAWRETVHMSRATRDVLPAAILSRCLGGPLSPSPVGISRPGIIACDLDGALLGSRRTPSADIVAGITALQECGVRVVPCTKRHVRWACDSVGKLGMRPGLAVCFGGAAVVDLETGRSLERVDLPPGAAAEIVDAVGGAGVAWVHDGGWEEVRFDAGIGLQASLGERGITRVVISHSPSLLKEPLRMLRRRWPDVRMRLDRRSGTLEIQHFAAEKWFGLRQAGALLGLGRERVLACADSIEDIDLLRWAGYSITTAAAPPSVRAVADVVAPRDQLAPMLRAFGEALCA